MSDGRPYFRLDGRDGCEHEVVELAGEHLERLVEIEALSFSNPWSVADFRWVVRDGRALCLGLQVGRELIGYAVGYVEDIGFHLANLDIVPACRRQGWGGRLLGQVLARAWRRGCRSCTLEVRASNRVAVQLYRQHGFRQVGVRSRYYIKPVENALVMHREIRASDFVLLEVNKPEEKRDGRSDPQRSAQNF